MWQRGKSELEAFLGARKHLASEISDDVGSYVALCAYEGDSMLASDM